MAQLASLCFVEDGLESIHVAVNKNARTYQTVKGGETMGVNHQEQGGGKHVAFNSKSDAEG
jgi:hypothetical protein